MKVLNFTNICKLLGRVQIISKGRKYTCPVKTKNGEYYFKFKNSWHNLNDYK